MIYRIYTRVNAADTMRDPDDIHITELGCSDDLAMAKMFAKKYIKEHFFHKDTELYESNGTIRATDFCSYGATLVIEPMNEI